MPSEISGRVLSPDTLIDYQTDAIVSRLLLKKATGSVTLFAFDRGQDLSEHTTPYDALISVVDGEAKITIAGESHTVSNGEMIILPASVPHSVNAVSRFKMVLTMIRV